MTFEFFKYVVDSLRGADVNDPLYDCCFLLLDELYGKICSDHIYDFITNNSDFESIEQLYEVVSDPISKYLTWNNPVPLHDLVFPCDSEGNMVKDYLIHLISRND